MLYSSRPVNLYHTTSGAAAEQILAGKRMYRGTQGCVGGGIYFADSIDASKRKARASGVTLRASVYLGNSLVVSSFSTLYTFTDLQNQGYDSITLTCLNGTEYIVFNCSQVRNIEVAENSVLKYEKCLQVKCARYGQKHYGGCGTLCSNSKCKMYGKLHFPRCKNKANSILWK